MHMSLRTALAAFFAFALLTPALQASAACPGDDDDPKSYACPGDDDPKGYACPGDDDPKSYACPGDDDPKS